MEIVEIISQYTPLRRKNGHVYQGLCPFHISKEPTLEVDRQGQVFYCPVCGNGGDVGFFLKKIGAIKKEERAGEDLPPEKELRLIEALLLAALFYHRILISPDGQKAFHFLLERGVREETIRDRMIGYAPRQRDVLTKYLLEKGYDPVEMTEIGLLVRNEGVYQDRYFNRIMLPIEDGGGNLVAFVGRSVGSGRPKYLLPPDTPVFRKRMSLFNLNRAKEAIMESGDVVLVEGYMDALSVYQAGIVNVVASQGTSITPEMADLLRDYTKKVIICYDGDDAGRDGAYRTSKTLEELGFDVKVALIPEGDPDELIRTKGVEEFRRTLSTSVPARHFRWRYDWEKVDKESSVEKLYFLMQVAEEETATGDVEFLARLLEIPPEKIIPYLRR